MTEWKFDNILEEYDYKFKKLKYQEATVGRTRGERKYKNNSERKAELVDQKLVKRYQNFKYDWFDIVYSLKLGNLFCKIWTQSFSDIL